MGPAGRRGGQRGEACVYAPKVLDAGRGEGNGGDHRRAAWRARAKQGAPASARGTVRTASSSSTRRWRRRLQEVVGTLPAARIRNSMACSEGAEEVGGRRNRRRSAVAGARNRRAWRRTRTSQVDYLRMVVEGSEARRLVVVALLGVACSAGKVEL